MRWHEGATKAQTASTTSTNDTPSSSIEAA